MAQHISQEGAMCNPQGRQCCDGEGHGVLLSPHLLPAEEVTAVPVGVCFPIAFPESSRAVITDTLTCFNTSLVVQVISV